MRSYPRNSPEAASRVVALVLIADGHVCRSEIAALRHLQVEQKLGLAPGSFAQVVHALCEDLLMGAYRSDSMMCSVDGRTLASLLAEVDDPALQAEVLRLAGAVAEADQCLAQAEALVMAAAHRNWHSTVGTRRSGLAAKVLQPT